MFTVNVMYLLPLLLLPPIEFWRSVLRDGEGVVKYSKENAGKSLLLLASAIVGIVTAILLATHTRYNPHSMSFEGIANDLATFFVYAEVLAVLLVYVFAMWVMVPTSIARTFAVVNWHQASERVLKDFDSISLEVAKKRLGKLDEIENTSKKVKYWAFLAIPALAYLPPRNVGYAIAICILLSEALITLYANKRVAEILRRAKERVEKRTGAGKSSKSEYINTGVINWRLK